MEIIRGNVHISGEPRYRFTAVLLGAMPVVRAAGVVVTDISSGKKHSFAEEILDTLGMRTGPSSAIKEYLDAAIRHEHLTTWSTLDA